jgi:hypothetical protein
MRTETAPKRRRQLGAEFAQIRKWNLVSIAFVVHAQISGSSAPIIGTFPSGCQLKQPINRRKFGWKTIVWSGFRLILVSCVAMK